MIKKRIFDRPVFYVKHHIDLIEKLDTRSRHYVAKLIMKSGIYPLVMTLKDIEFSFKGSLVNLHFSGFASEVPRFIGSLAPDQLYILKADGNKGVRFINELDRMLNVREFKITFRQSGMTFKSFPRVVKLENYDVFERFPEYLSVIENPHIGLQLLVLTHGKRSQIYPWPAGLDCRIRYL